MTPVFYIYMDKLQRRLDRKRRKRGERRDEPHRGETVPHEEPVPATAALRVSEARTL